MKQPIKEIQAYLDYGDDKISDSDNLISYKISCDSGLCKSAMRKLEAKYLGEQNLLGKWVRAVYGVRLADGSFEFLDYGSFLVTETTFTKDNGTTSIVAYDKMVNAMTPYAPLSIEYPVSLIDYTRVLCESCGLELGNYIFGNQLVDFSKARNNSYYVSHTFSNDVLTVSSTNATHQYVEYDITKLIKNNNGKILYFDFESIDFSQGKAPIIQMIISKGTVLSYAKLVDSAGKKQSYTIPESTDDITNAVLIVECNNSEISGESSITITKPMFQFGTKKLTYQKYNPMNDWQIIASKDADGNVIDLWENIEGITYRDILVQIAQATGSTCIIGNDDKVYFKELNPTGELLTYDNLFKLKLENLYGEINSVVLSRTPSEDNVYLQDEGSVQKNGLTEFKIENNEIIDKDRENAIEPIYNILKGISYYPFEATTEGLGWYEIADSIDVVNDTGDVFNTSIFNYSITVDGSIKETLKAVAESKTQTQYQYATTISKRVKNTEVIVNKQEQYIKQLIKDVYEENGIINEQYTQIHQDIEKIEHTVQQSGGNNLIKNSVMFAYDTDKKPSEWELSGDGKLTIDSDTEALKSGGLSGHSFMLSNKTVKQAITVSPTNYTFSTKIKKSMTGSCYVKIYEKYIENNEEKVNVLGTPIELKSGEDAHYKDYEIKGIQPKHDTLIVEFYGSTDSNATFTDNMLTVGEDKKQWTQANGEVMNTQVVINLNGITVKNGNTENSDFTVISTTEFAGYSYINGTPTRVFTLNKGVTEIKKLLAKDEIKMPPIKIVPITEGDMQGWAFVPAT